MSFLKKAKVVSVWLILASVCVLPGCEQKSKYENSHPNDLSAGVVEGIVKRFYGQDIGLTNLTYEPPIKSPGGRAPAGVELFPVKAHATEGAKADQEIEFYFFRAPYGWAGYPK